MKAISRQSVAEKSGFILRLLRNPDSFANLVKLLILVVATAPHDYFLAYLLTSLKKF